MRQSVELPSLSEASSRLQSASGFVEEFIALAERHALSDFVGLTLTHSHDELCEGEILLEEPLDDRHRLLTVVGANDARQAVAVVSAWRIAGGRLKATVSCGGCNQ